MKRVKFLIAVLVLLALPMISTALVSASPARIEVSPPVLMTSIAAGESKTHTMLVRSVGGNPMDVVLEVKGLGQSLDGEFQPVVLPKDGDERPFCAGGFISISPQQFHLEPGALQEIEVVIAVPGDAGDGARYAIIHARGKPVGGDIEIAIGTSVEVTIADTELIKAGSISDFTLGEIVPGEPLEITATFENTGNIRYKAWAEATLEDGAGSELARASAPLTTVSIIPGNSRQFNLSLTTPGEELPAGAFADLVIKLEDGTVLASQRERLAGVDNLVIIVGAVVGGLILTAIGIRLVSHGFKTAIKNKTPMPPAAPSEG